MILHVLLFMIIRRQISCYSTRINILSACLYSKKIKYIVKAALKKSPFLCRERKIILSLINKHKLLQRMNGDLREEILHLRADNETLNASVKKLNHEVNYATSLLKKESNTLPKMSSSPLQLLYNETSQQTPADEADPVTNAYIQVTKLLSTASDITEETITTHAPPLSPPSLTAAIDAAQQFLTTVNRSHFQKPLQFSSLLPAPPRKVNPRPNPTCNPAKPSEPTPAQRPPSSAPKVIRPEKETQSIMHQVLQQPQQPLPCRTSPSVHMQRRPITPPARIQIDYDAMNRSAKASIQEHFNSGSKVEISYSPQSVFRPSSHPLSTPGQSKVRPATTPPQLLTFAASPTLANPVLQVSPNSRLRSPLNPPSSLNLTSDQQHLGQPQARCPNLKPSLANHAEGICNANKQPLRIMQSTSSASFPLSQSVSASGERLQPSIPNAYLAATCRVSPPHSRQRQMIAPPALNPLGKESTTRELWPKSNDGGNTENSMYSSSVMGSHLYGLIEGGRMGKTSNLSNSMSSSGFSFSNVNNRLAEHSLNGMHDNWQVKKMINGASECDEAVSRDPLAFIGEDIIKRRLINHASSRSQSYIGDQPKNTRNSVNNFGSVNSESRFDSKAKLTPSVHSIKSHHNEHLDFHPRNHDITTYNNSMNNNMMMASSMSQSSLSNASNRHARESLVVEQLPALSESTVHTLLVTRDWNEDEDNILF